MADYKSAYSGASSEYVSKDVATSEVARGQYDRSKAREAKHGEKWKRTPVDINEVCARFAPKNRLGRRDGVKWRFKGDRYDVVADMASGYLRIRDKVAKKWCTLDGVPGDDDITHFKIKRRDEMK